jgi:hypothetical protein
MASSKDSDRPVRPLCIVPKCGQVCQEYAKPGMFGGDAMYLKTCSRHNMEDFASANNKIPK